DQAPLTLPDPGEIDLSPLHISVMEALAPGGAWFFRQLATAIGSTDDRALSAALWELVWSGRISNDTLAPLRALTRSGSTTHRSRRPPPPARAPRPRTAARARRGGPAPPPPAPGRRRAVPPPKPQAAGPCSPSATTTPPGGRT